jgi:hypothetical protein
VPNCSSMVNSFLIRCTPQVYLSLEKQLPQELTLLLLILQQIQQVISVLSKDASLSGSAMSHTNFGNCLGIYFHNVRGLRTKQPEFYDDVSSSDFGIICLFETWLNDLFYDHNLFLIGISFVGLTVYILTRLVVMVF